MNPRRDRAEDSTKRERLNIRTRPEDKALIEYAASARSVSASQFVMEAAIRSAEEVLADQTRFVLDEAQWERFAEALDRPARVVPNLKKAASKPSPFGER